MSKYLVAPYQVNEWKKSSIALVKGLVSKWPVLAIDVETAGNFDSLFEQEIIMLQLSNGVDVIVIDTRHEDPTALLKSLVKKRLIGHNIKYDCQMIHINYNVEFEDICDTMLAVQVLECGYDRPKGHFTLESVSRRYVNPYLYTLQGNLFMPTITKAVRKTFVTTGMEPFTDVQIEYGGLDALVTYHLYKKLEKALIEEDLLKVLEEVENPFCKVLEDMEIAGIKVHQQMWLENDAEASRIVSERLSELNGMIDHEINWNSPKQVGELFKSFGVDLTKFDRKTMEVKESVDKLTLEKQIAKHPIVAAYLAYRKAEKLRNTYGEKFLKHVDRNTGRIHSSFMQIMDTGRTSSTSPNMQNIERSYMYRKCFVPEEGNTFVIADFSNQEARILADLAQEPTMMKIFKDNKDLHLETARIMYNNPSLEKASKERKEAKSVNFLMSYGGGASKLSNTFGVSMYDARRTMDNYFKTFPALAPYFKYVGDDARNKGYIQHSTKFPRKTFIPFYEHYLALRKHIEYNQRIKAEINPLVKDKFGYYDSKIQRHAQNYRIQGLAATMSKLACILIRRALKRADLTARLILMVHDEVVVECLKGEAVLVKHIVETSMLKASKMVLKTVEVPAEAIIRDEWFKD